MQDRKQDRDKLPKQDGETPDISAAKAILEEARETLEDIVEKAEEVVQEATGTPEVEMPP